MQDGTSEGDSKYYEVSETSIRDKSMLGPYGQKLCGDVDVHWLIQTCSAAGNNTSKCRPYHSLANSQIPLR